MARPIEIGLPPSVDEYLHELAALHGGGVGWGADRQWNTALKEGRNILIDGDMEAAATTAWTAASATLSKETASPQAGTRNLRVTWASASNSSAYQVVHTVGRQYRITGYFRGAGSGSIVPRVLDGAVALATGTNSAIWQAFDVTYTATNTAIYLRAQNSTGAGEYVEFDSITITQLNIPANDPNMRGTVTGAVPVTSGQMKAWQFDGSGDAVNIYSPEFNSFFNPAACSLIAIVQVPDPAVWLDNAERNIFAGYMNATNLLLFRKLTDNTLNFRFTGSGVTASLSTAFTGTNTFLIAGTADAVSSKLVVNGSVVATGASVAPYIGNLPTGGVAIGSFYGNGSANVWNGLIKQFVYLREAASAAELLRLYNLMKGVV